MKAKEQAGGVQRDASMPSAARSPDSEAPGPSAIGQYPVRGPQPR
jgi:hypothetical protein